jgi:hypothetical protein
MRRGRGRSGCETVQLDSGGSGRRNRGAIVFLIFFFWGGREKQREEEEGWWLGRGRKGMGRASGGTGG